MTPSSKKLKVAVLYGGRSGEHEISLISAASVIRNLDPNRFEVVPVAIDKEGRWHLNDIRLIEQAKASKSLTIDQDAPEVVLPPNPSASGGALVPLDGKGAGRPGFDVVFPVMHGPLCEDGTIQGLLELADVAYVGNGVLSSAVGMDKDVAKRLARDAGLPVVPFITVKQGQWKRASEQLREQVARELGYPVFVKPANMGSSVGVHKVKEATQFDAAMNDALRYDSKVLIEQAVSAREIEIAVMENPDPMGLPLTSTVGEINPTHEFYSYEAKYLDENGAELLIPAKLTPEQLKQAQILARDVFVALECEGLARVDLFLDKNLGKFYLNEINTMPGFTQISMYPKLWEASGVSYQELLSKLIDLAVERHRRKRALVREFTPQ
jgi:D-alanine-D-alanine ligase